jgi:hypothetical protein
MPIFLIFLTALMVLTSSVERVRAQSDDVSSRDNQSNVSERATYYDRILDKLMRLDIRDILEAKRRTSNPTQEEKLAKVKAEGAIERRAREGQGNLQISPEEASAVFTKISPPFGKFKGSFPLKDGNTAYYFSLNRRTGSTTTGGHFTPGVRNGVDILGQPVKAVSSYDGQKHLSPQAVGTAPGYEVPPQYVSGSKVSREGYDTCETYLVVNPSGVVFFWSHKGNYLGCDEKHRILR